MRRATTVVPHIPRTMLLRARLVVAALVLAPAACSVPASELAALSDLYFATDGQRKSTQGKSIGPKLSINSLA